MTGHAISPKLLRAIAGLLAAFAALIAAPASAQTETIDWASAGLTNLQAAPSNFTATGTDGTSVQVSYSAQVNGGTFVPSYGGFLSYYTGTIGSAPQPLLLNFDNSSYDPNDKITTIFNLSEAVKNLQFVLTDIDNGSFRDAIEVYYDTGNGVWQNSATNSGFWTASVSVSRTSDAAVNGWTGVSPSDTAATNGDLRFNFGTTAVKRIRIVYFSYTGTGDPTGQFTGISDFSYARPAADLSLAKTALNASPASGATATFRLTLTNSSLSSRTATGVVVRDTLPAGFNYTGHTGTGTFNPTTGDWNAGTLAPGQSVTLDISGTINASAGAVLTNRAEVWASSTFDSDSTPANGATSEDDYATATMTVAGPRVAGTPPVLSCPNSNIIFDWDSISWTAGTTSASYSLGTLGNIGFSMSNPGTWLNNATVGGQSPSRQNIVHGGTGQFTLLQLVDMANTSQVVTTTISLPAKMQGAQFSIFDIDYAAGQFADRIEVFGRLNGALVTPTVTNGASNYVIGNTAYGDAASDSDRPDGNITVTFSQPIDTIVIRYGNHSLAPSDPGQQGIALHDINFCRPATALSVTKVSSLVSDPVNGTNNPKAIPGALVDYLITVSNTGISPTDANTISIADAGPPEAKMCFNAAGSGLPVVFTQGSPTSGLAYNFSSLTDAADHLEFSSDGGASWTYQPTADADGCDANITHFRIRPSGSMAAGSSFSLRTRYAIE
ncbi:DUF11 domain-containing protein [Erythrobacter sp. HKB08]|uniref:DUF11 domain-containing protein n=1 Tax=Erythrobacter sp. HKB08 TaxID=2502843 RepID=UPI001008DD30|nr:DUF11 domain-containing protein [Erythrobacter sp. HKB08]